MKKISILTLLIVFLTNSAFASSCSDSLDTFSDYNDYVEKNNNIKSEYYVLSYTWAPNHCSKISQAGKQPGKKDYLQCGSGKVYGYILHGLWPQGTLDGSGGYPRSCEGDQDKIERAILEDYLCMSPSVWLLQHEYEYHGTCMHDESLETPRKYFDTAMKLHSKIKLPKKQLKYNEDSINWFVNHNTHIKQDSIQYYKGAKEWQFCFDNDFNAMRCPSNNKTASGGNKNNTCKVKGNISKNSGKKYYFIESHRNYPSVVINQGDGERCFDNEQSAIDAGWVKAR